MKVLYIGVHSHIGWGAEYWLKQAFSDLNIIIDLIDYRFERKSKSNMELKNIINKKSTDCQIIFLQRGDKLSPRLFNEIKIPIIFWSTEPIQLKSDVDQLLQSNIFSWIFVHSYSCITRINKEFNHNSSKSSVMHNAAPKNKIYFNRKKNNFAIFNRSLSFRRRVWLWPIRNIVTKINGRFGDDYFFDLQQSIIAINIHYSKKNLDDFESGIFEAMASGCVIVSEKLHKQTLVDLGMENIIIEVNSAYELKNEIEKLKHDKCRLEYFQKKSRQAILHNTWHDRAKIMKFKFEEFCD